MNEAKLIDAVVSLVGSVRAVEMTCAVLIAEFSELTSDPSEARSRILAGLKGVIDGAGMVVPERENQSARPLRETIDRISMMTAHIVQPKN